MLNTCRRWSDISSAAVKTLSWVSSARKLRPTSLEWPGRTTSRSRFDSMWSSFNNFMIKRPFIGFKLIFSLKSWNYNRFFGDKLPKTALEFNLNPIPVARKTNLAIEVLANGFLRIDLDLFGNLKRVFGLSLFIFFFNFSDARKANAIILRLVSKCQNWALMLRKRTQRANGRKNWTKIDKIHASIPIAIFGLTAFLW